jgi:hypothetical protein
VRKFQIAGNLQSEFSRLRRFLFQFYEPIRYSHSRHWPITINYLCGIKKVTWTRKLGCRSQKWQIQLSSTTPLAVICISDLCQDKNDSLNNNIIDFCFFCNLQNFEKNHYSLDTTHFLVICITELPTKINNSTKLIHQLIILNCKKLHGNLTLHKNIAGRSSYVFAFFEITIYKNWERNLDKTLKIDLHALFSCTFI